MMKAFLRLLLILVATQAYSQHRMITEHYAVEDGLPNNAVYNSMVDSDGFVWLGTWHGLCSFDGSEFTPFLTRQTGKSDMPPRKVLNIVEDDSDNLWIRNADNHLYLFNKRTEEFFDMYNELKRLSQNVQVIKIQRADNGNVLVLTRNKNLYEGRADSDGKARFTMVFDGCRHVNKEMRLTHNVIGETDDRVYWIDTQLQIGDIKKTSKRHCLSGIPADEDFTCFMRSNDDLYLGTEDGKVYILDIKTGKARHYSFNELQSPVTCIVPIYNNVYVSTAAGLFSFTTNGTIKKLSAGLAQAERPFVDKQNKLWLYLKRKAIVRYDPQTDESQQFTISSDSLSNTLKYADAGEDGLFMLLPNGEVWHYDRNTHNMHDIKIYDRSYINDLHFHDLCLDGFGKLWLSSTSNGIYKVSFLKNNFSFLYPEMPVFADKSGIRAAYQSRNGDLWIGNRNGELYCTDIRTGEVKRQFGRGEIGTVYHIMEDNKGNIWLSTKGSGLVKATPDATAPQGLRLTRYRNSANDKFSISSNRVYNTFQDKKGRIWVCTFDGGLNLIDEHSGKTLFLSKNNSFRNYPKYDLYMNVRVITEDLNGRLWAGTTDGLMSFDGDFSDAAEVEFETYREHGSALPLDNDIFTIYRDSQGGIWMGIFGCGLNKLEEYDAKNRLPIVKSYGFIGKKSSDVVVSIIEDSRHHLWICSESGLASLDTKTSYLHSYGRFSGFPNVTIEDNTSVFTRDGRILIGCRRGILAFDPAIVEKENNAGYNTFIVDFDVLNHNTPIYEGSLRYAKEIVLSHDQNVFSIKFATPVYNEQNQIFYAYILDGYEEQWHSNSDSRTASYANVPPGHYKFRVKSLCGDSPECVLSIVVRPPWWATWWAYLIYGVIILLAAYGIVRLVLYMIRIRNEVYLNDKLAELKLRFFTNVSHELRTPLTLIKGPIDELKNGENLSNSGKEYLDLIDRNASKMLQLVNQILDFRKIQNGKMKLRVSYVNLNDMIALYRQEYRVMAEERDIAFNFDIPQDSVMVWCDSEKIGTVMSNLISNAFKFTREGGTICVALEQDSTGETCRIRVEDDGVSIPNEQLDSIFERFSQVDNKPSGDTAHTGTGIGLSLSREYVNMHHGRIWAENNPNEKGVSFIVELPTGKKHFSGDIEVYIDDISAKAAAETAEEPSDINPELSGILVIEDNIDLCRMMRLQLSKNYNVFTAHDGEEGLKNIYRYRPDIIITDLMMPKIGGMELLQRVRNDFNISHTPVIVLTAKHNDEDKMEAIRTGANAYITKPFSTGHLMARINQLLNEQQIFQRKMVLSGGISKKTDTANDEYEQRLVKKDVEFVHKVHDIIEKNLNSNDFNITTIAETMGVSRSVFFKKLKSLTGFAPVDLVKEIRLAKAAEMIDNTNDSITEIAYAVGFSDAGYFAKCFRQKFGKNPKDYRRKTGNS